MTINEALLQCDTLQPNAFSREDKLRWLARLDGMVLHEIIRTHQPLPDEGEVTEDDVAYDAQTDGDTPLLIPQPYEQLYLLWLGAMMDFHQGEFARYNNALSLFNETWRAFAALYNRTHRPIPMPPVRIL